MFNTVVFNEKEKKIASEIVTYVEKEGSNKSSWYLGIASNPKDRLFKDHNVSENGWWIYSDAETHVSARNIENYLLNSYGFDGGTGGGDYTTKFVYAYRKTHTTNP